MTYPNIDFLKKGQFKNSSASFLSVAALLHDFCPLVQRCLLVGEHNCSLLLQTEITSTRFLAVDRSLLDDSPLYVELRLSFQMWVDKEVSVVTLRPNSLKSLTTSSRSLSTSLGDLSWGISFLCSERM